jgi:polyvinyl alcohol dehydrogenase (cytochrome)
MAAVMERIRDPLRPMPPPPNAALSQADIALLDAFIAGGAQGVSGGCLVEDPSTLPPGNGSTGEAGTGSTTQNPPVVAEPPPTTEDGTQSGPRWTQFGYDLASGRSNPDETTLSAQNVSGLRRLWEVSVQGSTSTPAVADGVVYLPAWDGRVHALRLEDGAQVWVESLPDLIDSSPALGGDRVFVSDDNGAVHALDRMSGDVVWSEQVDAHPETHLWSSPIYVAEAELVIVGVASGDEAMPPGSQTFRGSVVGLDAQSGSERWRFDTTSGGQSGPGIAVWATAAVDTERKLAYIGTGNNYAAPSGPYADSMLAIDYENGQLAWFTQFTADDVFVVSMPAGPDFDIGSTANLFSAGGSDLVGIGVKSGIYYALDRDAGTIAWMTQITAGSPLGGVISPSAYHDGVIFVASNVSLMGNTTLAALRATDGGILWMHDIPTTSYGGVAHANGVVYLGVTGGTIHALDASSGNELWSDVLPNAIAGGPSIVDGTLLVPWGYQWTLREGNPVPGGLVAYGL